MKTYYFCHTDGYGQRTGTYESIELMPNQITVDRFGFETYKGMYLYDNEYDAKISCQS